MEPHRRGKVSRRVAVDQLCTIIQRKVVVISMIVNGRWLKQPSSKGVSFIHTVAAMAFHLTTTNIIVVIILLQRKSQWFLIVVAAKHMIIGLRCAAAERQKQERAILCHAVVPRLMIIDPKSAVLKKC